jgi:long-subunit acyl-CoA synthetase (AMP-forming)
MLTMILYQRLIMVPTILQGLLKKGLAEKMGQAGHLTYVLIGAAPLGSWLQEKGGEALGVRLVQGYGESMSFTITRMLIECI